MLGEGKGSFKSVVRVVAQVMVWAEFHIPTLIALHVQGLYCRWGNQAYSDSMPTLHGPPLVHSDFFCSRGQSFARLLGCWLHNLAVEKQEPILFSYSHAFGGNQIRSFNFCTWTVYFSSCRAGKLHPWRYSVQQICLPSFLSEFRMSLDLLNSYAFFFPQR